MAFARELEVALHAVRIACKLTHNVAKSTHVSALQKTDNSPVTVADFGAQAVIISAIHREFPDDPVVGEEDSQDVQKNPKLAEQLVALTQEFAGSSDARFSAAQPRADAERALCEAIDLGNAPGSPRGRQWALDPVDGTKGFLRGGQYAVCLALIVDSVVQVGVIGCPNLGEHGGLFYAVKGQGGEWVPLYGREEAPQALRFRHISQPADAQFCESVESGHSALGRQAKIAKELGIVKPSIRMDSQAKYCVLAKGDADIYLRLPISLSYEEKIWDHAAGSLLITEAGGMVTDMFGQPLDFGQGRTLRNNKGVVASSRVLQSRILAALAESDRSDS